jgi:hypothetical protein
MTEDLDDQRFDRQIRAYLESRGEDLGLAPTAAEMAMIVVGRGSSRSPRARGVPRLVWFGIAALLTLALVGVLVVGGGMLPTIANGTPAPTSPRQPGEVPGNGWIAYPTRAHDAQSGNPARSVIPGEINLARLGEASHRLTGGVADIICPSFSPDGAKLSYVEGDDLVVLGGDPATTMREEYRFRDIGRRSGTCPVWSPSSQSFAVLTGDDLSVQTLKLTILSLTAVEITVPVSPLPDATGMFANDNPLAWAPDGGVIAYAALDGIWLVHLDGTNPQRLSEEESRSVSWSPDGSRLVYSDEEGRSVEDGGGGFVDAGGTVTVLTVRAPSELILLGRGDDPMWAPSTEEVAFRAGDGLKIAQADGSGSRLVHPSGYGFGGWSPVGDYLLMMIDVSGHSYDLVAVSTTGGANTVIAAAIETGSSRNFPDMGDVSWQPVYP